MPRETEQARSIRALQSGVFGSGKGEAGGVHFIVTAHIRSDELPAGASQAGALNRTGIEPGDSVLVAAQNASRADLLVLEELGLAF
jgi:hypothetical protein